MKYVQFEDETHSVITAVFGCPQDPESRHNLGEVEDDDERFIDYVASLPEQFRAAVLAA